MILPTQVATVRTTARPAVPTSGTIRHPGRRCRPFTRALAFVIVMAVVSSKDTKADQKIDPARTGRDADAILQKLLPPRSDTPDDWHAPVECLHAPGEPRSLRPYVPPPPCDPSQPPHPYDLVGVPGSPTCGPIYRGPCEPRSGKRHNGSSAWYHHWHDRMFDHFYRSK